MNAHTQSAKPETRMIRYWHPRLGGWHHAYLVRAGRKWAVVRDIRDRKYRVAVTDVREVAA